MLKDEDPVLERYFFEIEQSSGYSRQEECALGERIKCGDETAINALVSANLRFVVSIAKNYRGLGLPFSDLINEGNLGMIRAARNFDADRGYRFISYAVWWIREAIVGALAEQTRLVRLPRNDFFLQTRLSRTRRRLEQELGRAPNIDELAQELCLSTKKVQLLFETEELLYMDRSSADGRVEQIGHSIIPDEAIGCTDASFSRDELNVVMARALCDLNENEAKVLVMYFGLEANPPMTLAQIGKHLGRTRERVRQIKVLALNKLRRSGSGKKLRAFLCD